MTMMIFVFKTFPINPASLLSGCYRTGSAKITMGTGSFLDVVTDTPHASLNGLIPLVAWRIPRYCDQSQVT